MDTTPPASTFPLFIHLPTELRLKIWTLTLPESRILKINYIPSQNRYVSSTTPPPSLAVNRESRAETLLTYSYLHLGAPTSSPLPIPVNFTTDTLYLSGLAPILQTHLHDLLYNLSTSASRHRICRLAIDRRVWNELCENGFLGVLCRMRALREVCMVVEFGRERDFAGGLEFLDAPVWRGDLRWVAEMAGREMREERKKLGAFGDGVAGRGKWERGGGLVDMEMRCVILTKGGEQA